MKSTFTLSDAKTRSSEIVERAVNGETFIVTRMGRPAVRISRHKSQNCVPKLGDLAGRIRISDDFDDWPPDLRESLGVSEPFAEVHRNRSIQAP